VLAVADDEDGVPGGVDARIPAIAGIVPLSPAGALCPEKAG
jgi:hypothetical protein